MTHRLAMAIVGIALVAALVLSMATSLVEEAPHEWIGVAVFALAVAHVALSRKALLARLRKRSAASIANLALDALLLACLLGQLASSLVLSEHVLSWAPAIEGAAWARPMHMLCAYWGFALAFVHGGLHARPYGRHLAKRPAALVLCRVICIVLALFGAAAFVQMDVASYMVLRIQFAFADHSVPLATRLLCWLGIGMAFACAAHYLSSGLRLLFAEKQNNPNSQEDER